MCLGTIRVVFVSKGFKHLAPLVGFFEKLVWLLAIGQIMQNLTSPVCYIAYALGFSTGNFLGILIAEKLSLGVVLLCVVTHKKNGSLIRALGKNGFGVTTVDGKGGQGPVNMLFTIIQRKDLSRLVAIIQKYNPRAFYSIEEVWQVKEGIFPLRKGKLNFVIPQASVR